MKTKITTEMVDSIWNSFKTKIQEKIFFDKKQQGKIIKQLSKNENSYTGVSIASAQIYFKILFYLVNGKQNQRDMKIEDMKKYCQLIWNEFPEYRVSLIKSLRESNKYWKKCKSGNYTSEIEKIIDELIIELNKWWTNYWANKK